MACTLLVLGALGPVQAVAQVPKPAATSTYEVVRGDTLFKIAGKTRPQGATVFQMIVALYHANPDAFLGGNINQLVMGKVLTIPPGEKVMATDAAAAASEYRALVAKPLSPVSPAAAPAAPPPAREPAPAPKPRPVPSGTLTPAQAEERFQQGLQAERRGDLRAAMASYREAAESGYGPAQRRLGEIYNTGNAVVPRDYETALKWYQKAREQGIEIPKPLTHSPIPPK